MKKQIIFLSVIAIACAAVMLPTQRAFAESDRNEHNENRALVTCKDFLSHEDMGLQLERYVQDYPGMARLFTIGFSVEGREIWALKISADPDVESAEPEIRIVGGTHGNECISAAVVMEFIDWVLTNYGDDDFASNLVDGAETVFVPLVNPDGYSWETAGRYNANGVDLNRNYGFGWIEGYQNGGERPFTEPETMGMRELTQESSFVLGLSYHTVIAIISGPWNYRPGNMEAEGDIFQAMSDAYAAGDPLAGTLSAYDPTPGFDWGSTNGDMNDWSQGARGILDWTIEMRSDTDMEWEFHLTGFKGFLSYAFWGVEGVVTDAETGEPVSARIETVPSGTPVFTDPEVGDYHRVLGVGEYNVTAFAQGYEPMTVTDVLVPDAGVAVVDFELERIGGDAGVDVGLGAFAIAEMRMPQVINPNVTYNNDTWAFYALGEPDGLYYSMSVDGSMTLDMGEGTWIGDADGADFEVLSGTGSEDPVTVLVSVDEDGPFVEVGNGAGDLEIDISGSGYSAIRYVRLNSGGTEEFYTATPGYDLDAVVIGAHSDADVDSDTDTDSDTGSDSDAGGDTDTNTDTGSSTDADTDSDSDTDIDSDTNIDSDNLDMTSLSAGSGCAITAKAKNDEFVRMIVWVLSR